MRSSHDGLAIRLRAAQVSLVLRPVPVKLERDEECESLELDKMTSSLYSDVMMSSPRLDRRLPSALEFGAALVAYGVVLAISILALKSLPSTSGWRAPVALTPMLPAAAVLAAVMRHVSRVDELQRQQLLESLALAFAGTALLTFGYGFLENVGFPHLSWFFVWAVMAVLWALGALVTHVRYR